MPWNIESQLFSTLECLLHGNCSKCRVDFKFMTNSLKTLDILVQWDMHGWNCTSCISVTMEADLMKWTTVNILYFILGEIYVVKNNVG